MLDDTRKTLVKYRLEQSRECLFSAKLELEAGSFKASANRSYYCVFHAMRAVLAIDGFDTKKHSGIISAFRQRYIKTGVFPSSMSDTIRDVFDVRTGSDYEDFFVISKEDVQVQADKAAAFIDAVNDYVNTICQ